MKLAVIPARGGSKRIPRKNIRNFLGKPIISYSIETAKAAGCFDKLIVSTDDEVIARVASDYGADIPFLRPSRLADDYATTGSVIKHAVDFYARQSVHIDYVCCIYATAPLLEPQTIRLAYRQLVKATDGHGTDFIFSAAKYHHPIQRAFRKNSQGFSEMFFPEHYLARSQDLEPAYYDAGQFYWGTEEAFREQRAILGDRSKFVVLPDHCVQDIDTEQDWWRAEQRYREIHNG